MPHRANRWSLAGAAMVGAAALVVVVVLVMAAGGGPSTVPVPAASASHAPASSGPPSLSPTAVPEQPVVGFGFSAVDDPPAHQLVLFGGVDSYDTTWLWTGSDWSLARPSLSPPGRFGAAAAYDPLTRVVMLFGGRLGPGDVVNDTWAWNGTTWRELNAGTAGPPPGEGSVMAWDDTLQTMVLVTGGAPSGETWVWGGGRWVRRLSGDLPVAVSSMAVDPVTHLLLAVGWTTSTPGNPS
ncbi:MAG: hypothetical protein ACRENL_05910, partial [Candidatus Dormibacteria bacterium]